MRFPEFEEEWDEKRLGELLEFKNGINASKEQYGKGIKFINVLDILNNDFITYESIIGLVDIDEYTLEKYSVKYGDILFQRSSETREEVGTANVYLDKEKTAAFGGFVIRGKKIGNYSPIFFNMLLKTDVARDSITSKSGGSTRYNVGQEVLTSVALYFPSLSEQQKIASFLSLIDSRIQTQNKIIEGLQSFKNAIIDKLFCNDKSAIHFPGFIKEWKEYSFRELFEIGTKRNNDNSIQTVLSASQVYGMIERDEIDIDIKYEKKTTTTYKIIEPGDYVIHLRSFQGGFAFSEKKGISSPAYTILKPKPILQYSFFKDYFMSKKFIELLKLVTYGVRDGRSISVDEFLKLKIHIPSFEEQTKIIAFILAFDKKLKLNNEFLQTLLNQKRYFLQNLFI